MLFRNLERRKLYGRETGGFATEYARTKYWMQQVKRSNTDYYVTDDGFLIS